MQPARFSDMLRCYPRKPQYLRLAKFLGISKPTNRREHQADCHRSTYCSVRRHLCKPNKRTKPFLTNLHSTTLKWILFHLVHVVCIPCRFSYGSPSTSVTFQMLTSVRLAYVIGSTRYVNDQTMGSLSFICFKFLAMLTGRSFMSLHILSTQGTVSCYRW